MQQPHTTRNYEGAERRVGVEIEFGGLDTEAATRVVADVVGGSIAFENPFVARVEGTRFGDFRIELDADSLQNERYRDVLESLGVDLSSETTARQIDEIVAAVAGTVVPTEVCMPPIPISELDVVETIASKLREAGARGTSQSFLYAFGLQFNPEVAALDAGYILAVLRAFVVSFEDICNERGIDLTRRLFPYVRPFSDEFIAHFCNPDYAPAADGLIDDYLDLNPSRNRPLDLLPLLAFMDEERVLARAAEPHLIKPRPTFHYRLPDCRIDQRDWAIAEEWSVWLAIEDLARDDAALRERLARHGGR